MVTHWQLDWVAVLYGSGACTVDGLRAERDARRFELYRASVKSHLDEALAATYPVVEKLTGLCFFAAATRRYIQVHPSREGDIHAFGGAFAAFLQRYPPARSLPYLPDVARLEWLAHRAFHAADRPAVAIDALARVPDADLTTMRVELHPALFLMQSEYPVHRIWEANQDGSSDSSVNLDQGGVDLMVCRIDGEIVLAPLDALLYGFVARLGRGETLADAADACHNVDPDFDLGQALHAVFSLGCIVGVTNGAQG